jgi:hypothetical protein
VYACECVCVCVCVCVHVCACVCMCVHVCACVCVGTADDGAVGALAKHASLLAAGVVGVEGAFERANKALGRCSHIKWEYLSVSVLDVVADTDAYN